MDAAAYEMAKRARLLEEVCGARPSVVLEVGCSVGANLSDLAAAFPSSRVVGVDVSARAVGIARARLRGMPNVEVMHVGTLAEVPRMLPAGSVDLVVVSEVLYYMGGRRRIAAELAPLVRLLSPSARAVLVHSCVDAEELHSSAVRALGASHVRSSWEPADGCPGGFLVTSAARSPGVRSAAAPLPVSA